MKLSLFRSLDQLFKSDPEGWNNEFEKLGIKTFTDPIIALYGREDGWNIIQWVTYCYSAESDRRYMNTDPVINKRIIAKNIWGDDAFFNTKLISMSPQVSKFASVILDASIDRDISTIIVLQDSYASLQELSFSKADEDATGKEKMYVSRCIESSSKGMTEMDEKLKVYEEKVKEKLKTITDLSSDITNSTSDSYEESLERLKSQAVN